MVAIPGMATLVTAITNAKSSASGFGLALERFAQKFSDAQGDSPFGTAALLDTGAASGVAPLDGARKVPVANLPTGDRNGIAPLDGARKVPVANLPRGDNNGIAPLDASGKVPAANINFPAPGTIVSAVTNGYNAGALEIRAAIVNNVGDHQRIVFNPAFSNSLNAVSVVPVTSSGIVHSVHVYTATRTGFRVRILRGNNVGANFHISYIAIGS